MLIIKEETSEETKVPAILTILTGPGFKGGGEFIIDSLKMPGLNLGQVFQPFGGGRPSKLLAFEASMIISQGYQIPLAPKRLASFF